MTKAQDDGKMKIKTVFWNDLEGLKSVVTALQAGQVVVGTSDTVLGLLAPCTASGMQKLNEIKGRANKPYLVLIANADKLAHFIDSNNIARIEQLAAYAWPGPLTLVCRVKDSVPSYLQSSEGTIGLRVPDHAGLLTVLQHFNGLFSTSANKAGQPIPDKVADLHSNIINSAAFLVTEEQLVAQTLPSTILDCSGERIRVLRVGAFSIEELEAVVGESFER